MIPAQDRFRRVELLFRDACDLPAESREAFLSASAENDSIRDQVRKMLRVDSEASGVLDAPAFGVGIGTADFSGEGQTPLRLPEFIGPYRVIRVLGQGGMGIVYEAEQDNPRRRVALKVLRRDWSSEQLLGRFRRESDILGRLQHPGIAQILEAGSTDDGDGNRPFIAMEYVHGKPLLSYAREHGLNRRARLELMALVCDAVQYAHQNGVVHRDLKPANIMVVQASTQSIGTRSGGPTSQPKILDFGVSRLTDPESQALTLHTTVGELIGTVPYMSPEQAGGDPKELDWRSDVYSLGVILCELLTDRLPHDVRRMLVHEAVRVIREGEPTPAGSIDRSLRGDIETIIAKALEKDKSRRYQSAADMGADIRRHLDQQPIIARPATAIYRVRKFAKRNKAIVAGVSFAFLAMVGATVVSVAHAIETERARQRESEMRSLAEARTAEAETAREQAEASNRFLAEMIGSSDPDEMGKDIRISDVLAHAAREIGPRFPDHPKVRSHLRRNIGITYRQLGILDEAESLLSAAVEDARLGHGEDHSTTMHALRSLAVLFDEQGKYEQSLPMHRDILSIQQRTLGASHRDTLGSACNIGLTLLDLRRYDEAGPILSDTVASMREVLGIQDRYTINAIQGLGSVRLGQGRLEDAETAFTEARDAAAEAFGRTDLRVITAIQSLAEIEQQRENPERAIELLDDAMERAEEVFPNRHWKIGRILQLRAMSLAELDRFDEAESAITVAHRIFEASFGDAEGTMTSDAAEALVQIQNERRDAESASERRD